MYVHTACLSMKACLLFSGLGLDISLPYGRQKLEYDRGSLLTVSVLFLNAKKKGQRDCTIESQRMLTPLDLRFPKP